MDRRSWTAEHDQAAIRALRKRRDGPLDVAGIAHVEGAHLHASRRRQRLDYSKQAGTGRDSGLTKDGRSRHAWGDLLEKFQPFPPDRILEYGEAGRVAAGARQALDVAGANRVADTRKYDRHGTGRVQ